MVIDIKKSVIRKTFGRFISLIILAVIMCALLFLPFRKDLINGLENSMLAIFFAIAYVIYTLYEAFRNYNYIYFSDESDKIVLRYFPPGILTTRKNSIEILKKDFDSFELKSFFMRYRESIILYKKTPKGRAKYPPVSITALSEEERYSLLFTLNTLKRKNEKA